MSTVHVWTLKVLESIVLQLPLKSFVHQRYVTAPLPSPVRIPAVNANPYGGYIRPAYGQRLLAGIENPAAREFRVPGRDFQMSTISAPPGLGDVAKANLLPLVPRTGQSDWEIEKAGLLSFSLDGEPCARTCKALSGPLRGRCLSFRGIRLQSGFRGAAGTMCRGRKTPDRYRGFFTRPVRFRRYGCLQPHSDHPR